MSLFRPRPHWPLYQRPSFIFSRRPAQSAAVGVATETDTSLALARVKLLAAGIPTETDAAIGLGRLKIKACGTATESDTCLALGRVKLLPAGTAAETDSALGLSRVKLRQVGLASETDAAFALSSGNALPVGLATETDSGLALARLKIKALGRSDEVDAALALSSAAVAVTPEVFTGGFYIQFEREVIRRRKRLKELDEREEETERIQAETDRQIAELFRAQEREATEREENERFQRIARQYQTDTAIAALGERAAKALARAAIQGNFSAIEALIREVQRAIEEEEFLIRATILAIELNDGPSIH